MGRSLRDESGVSLIMVAVAILVLTSFLAFVLDHGVLMVGRTQAQHAADAGALAGTISIAFDETVYPPPPGGTAELAARKAVGINPNNFGARWGDAVIAWQCPAFAAGDQCARVDVHADGTNNSDRLPVFFAHLLGITGQQVRATATAHVAIANHTNCLKPFMIPDYFQDINGNGIYDAGDAYTAPGYTTDDIGTVLVLRAGAPNDAAAPSTYYSIEDASDYYDNIVKCQLSRSIGDTVTMLPGRKQGPTKMALADLLIDGPVTVAIALFSPVVWEASRNTGSFPMVIENIMGFCIDPADQHGSGVTGTICALPGDLVSGPPGPPSGAGFLKVIQLIR